MRPLTTAPRTPRSISRGTLTPAAVNVNGTVNSYTFQGNGQFAAGNLTNNNPNTLTILTTNTGGNITINAGTVQYGNGATAGAPGNGSVFNNSALVFNEPDVETLGGPLSGAGSLLVQAGGLRLSGNNAAYSGTTTITTNTTLQVGVGSGVGTLGSGSVTDEGVLIFNRSGALTYGGAISGSGSVSNIGPGTVTLSGANSYVGFTYVNGGTLQVGIGHGHSHRTRRDQCGRQRWGQRFGGGYPRPERLQPRDQWPRWCCGHGPGAGRE